MSTSHSTLQKSVFQTPWRPFNLSDREQMLQKLKDFQSARGVDHLRILVVGPTGSGKSSFITSVNNVLQGRITYLALSHGGEIVVTRKYDVYKVQKGTEGSLFPFVFGDTMGLLDGSSGPHTADIIKIVQGHVREGYTFKMFEELTPESKDFIGTPSLNDKVHCLVFVLSGDRISTTDEQTYNNMKLVLEQARELGIPQVVIMSKVDQVCPLVSQDLKMIYKSMRIKQKMEECCRYLNVSMNYIFPVKNYHEEITTNLDADILILTAVTNIVDFANDFVRRNM